MLSVVSKFIWVHMMAWVGVGFPGLKLCPSPALVVIFPGPPSSRGS